MRERDTKTRSCKTCFFWAKGEMRIILSEEAIGDCRRRAPKDSRFWPITLGSDWCGEYEPDNGVRQTRPVAACPVQFQPPLDNGWRQIVLRDIGKGPIGRATMGGFSNRALNALENAGIRTLGELWDKTEGPDGHPLIWIRGLGAITAQEIEKKTAQFWHEWSKTNGHAKSN